MPTISFTARSIESLQPAAAAQVDYWDEGLAGFGIRVAPTGRKSWIVMYRASGRLRRLTLGKYPIIGLADARRLAQETLYSAAIGSDPAAEKKAKASADTFGELAAVYLERYAKERKRSWREDERIINRELLPFWTSRKAAELRRRDVIELLDRIVDRGSPIQANRVLAVTRKIFNFGISRDLVESNPCHLLPAPGKERARDRVLNADEIRALWNGLESEQQQIAAFFRLSFLTAQRSAEIKSMAWKDLDLETGWWTIPGTRAKNGLSHRVPLAGRAIEILRGLPRQASVWVFPSPKDPMMHIDWVQKAVQRLRRRSGIDFCGHDIRRTVASQLTSIGVPRLVVSKLLNHKESSVTAVYDRHSYDVEKQHALQTWESCLDQLIRGHRMLLVSTKNLTIPKIQTNLTAVHGHS